MVDTLIEIGSMPELPDDIVSIDLNKERFAS